MHRVLATAALATMMLTGTSFAAEFTIQMLNKGSDGAMFVFQPDFIKAQPGDTINFVPTDKGHDVATIKGMVPDGAAEFKSRYSQPFSVTLTKPGVYGLRCTPHYGLGMVALIEVGNPVNEDAAKAVHNPPRAAKVFAQLFAQLDKDK